MVSRDKKKSAREETTMRKYIEIEPTDPFEGRELVRMDEGMLGDWFVRVLDLRVKEEEE